jgi:hypothetical protein
VFQDPQFWGGGVTKFKPREALNLIAKGKLTVDGRVVLHTVVSD